MAFFTFFGTSLTLILTNKSITDSKGNQKSIIKTRYGKVSYIFTKEAIEYTWLSWEANCPITFGPLKWEDYI